ncbi:MAG: sigma-54-dependent Fis family transcriptional regulator [Deltaproteobacteria bacterium]|nr:sigma-54-dependent Fis family transcriptional regulator [Deltaproteobacteria bacterium]
MRCARRAERALGELRSWAPALVLSDVRMPGMDGFGLLDALRASRPGLPVILLTAFGDVELAMQAVRRGARDFLTKPVKRERVLAAIARALPASDADTDLVRESEAMQQLFERLERVAGSDASVLLEGETGTGKGRVARHLHSLGRGHEPLVELSCGAIPSELFEAELFGVAAGAYTGAGHGRPGVLARAGRGSVLLDDVDALTARGQAALLRALGEGRYREVGGVTERSLEARVLATSAADLERACVEGRFRQDLFYRLATFRLRLPALRERLEDIPALLRLFLGQLALEHDQKPPDLRDEALVELSAHAWPGNVRELEAVATRLWLTRPTQLGAEDVRRALGRDALDENAEVARLRAALRVAQGNKSEAARLLGLSRGTLYKRLQTLDAESRRR